MKRLWVHVGDDDPMPQSNYSNLKSLYLLSLIKAYPLPNHFHHPLPWSEYTFDYLSCPCMRFMSLCESSFRHIIIFEGESKRERLHPQRSLASIMVIEVIEATARSNRSRSASASNHVAPCSTLVKSNLPSIK